jgi:predicted peptidase
MKIIREDNTDNIFPYFTYIPERISSSPELLIQLHGAGERGNGESELERVNVHGIARYLNEGTLSIDGIALCPQCPTGQVWNQRVYDLKELLDEIVEKYAVDKKRITATGLSMGGFGTWEMGMTFPDTFAALAPVCGGGMAWRTPALSGKKIWAFHGNADTVVNISNSIDMVNGARKNGADVRFTIFDGVAHHSWENAYEDTRVVEFLLGATL